MTFKLSKIAAIIAAVIAVVAFAIGYPLHNAYKKHQLQKAVIAIVGDTGAKLSDSLRMETNTQTADTPESLAGIDANASQADSRLEELRGMNASRDRALVDTAIDYMISARQMLRMQATMRRDRQKLAQSMQTLREHMRAANRRAGEWIEAALQKKQQFENDYSDVRRTTETFGRLVDTYPDARAAMAALVDPKLLAEDALAQEARRLSLETLKRIADDAETTRQMAR